jgi:sortilin (neurotensin receptor 3)
MRRAALAAGLCLAGLLSTANAGANGRFPASSQIVVSPTDPQLLFLRATYALLVSHDGGCNWDFLCEPAVGYLGQEDPFLGLTSSAALAAIFEGLKVSPDQGCSWAAASGVPPHDAIDLVVRRDDPHAAVALTTSLSGTTDAGSSLYATQLYATSDDGASWSALGAALDPTVIPETVEVAPGDPSRVYVSSIRGSGASLSAQLFVSTDGAATWTEHALPIDPSSERSPYVAAVDPQNPDLVYLRIKGASIDTKGDSNDRLVVTKDRGATFTTAYRGGALLGFALSPDGSKVYLGGPTDGLLLAPASTLAFQQVSPAHVQCLTAAAAGALYICSDESTGYIAGRSDDDGATVTPLLHLSTIRGPLACAPGTSAAICSSDPWDAAVQQLGGSAAPGTCAGVSPAFDAGPGGAGGGSTPSGSGGGCDVGESRTAAWGLGFLAALLGLSMLVTRRRR